MYKLIFIFLIFYYCRVSYATCFFNCSNLNPLECCIRAQDALCQAEKLIDQKTKELEIYVKSLIPIGSIIPFSGITTPENWIFCDGRELNRENFIILFKTIGTTYGDGNKVSTFNIPDLRGRTLIGTGTGNGLTPRNLGQKGGEENHQLNINELPQHSHQITMNYDNFLTPNNIYIPSPATNTLAFMSSGTIGSNTAGGNDGNAHYTGNNYAHNNMQPFLSINYIIKVL